jgi:hypothetical protein
MRTLHDGLQTAYAIAQQIPWMVNGGSIAFRDLADWDKRMAITETIAHLKLLMEEDIVGNVDMNGASLYLSKD